MAPRPRTEASPKPRAKSTRASAKTRPKTTRPPPRPRTKRKTPPAATLTKTFAFEPDRNPVRAYLNRLGPNSARVMGAALDSIADILSRGKVGAAELAWHEIGPEHVSALRGRLHRLYAPATANTYLAALRAVLKEAWRLGFVDRESMARALDVPPIKGSRELRGRAVQRDQLLAVLEVCRTNPNTALGARDAAILTVLYGGGLRRAEAAALDLQDLDHERKALAVSGKGNKARTVFLPPGVARILAAWLERRGSEAGPIFTRITKSGAVRLKPISHQLIYRVVEKCHRAAGVEPFTPHDLRRSFISDLLDEGVDIATIARKVGHANVQTTARYDRRDDRTEQKAALLVDVPSD